jgi:di/tricarboxylate transporter
MMALNSINRLASTVLLTGGITPVVAAALIGGIYWSQWLLLMSVPYIVLLALGSLLIYWLYRRGFDLELPRLDGAARQPLTGKEWRTIAITAGPPCCG